MALKVIDRPFPEPSHRVTSAPVNISMVSDAFSTSTRTADVLAIFNAIKNGRYREQCAQIRRIYKDTLKRTGSHEEAKKAVEHRKKQLPGVIWSGTFRDRVQPVKDKLIQHSGLFCADIDVDALAGKDRNEVRAKLRASPHVLACFSSPTGHGLKVIVRVRADALRHEGNFLAVQQHVLKLTGVQIDESGKDLGRLCFVSYDPDAYLNLNAQEITPLPRLVVKTLAAPPSAEQRSKPSKAEIREMLAVIPKRPKYHDWYPIAAAVGDALPEEEAVEILKEWSPEEKPGEYSKKLRSGFTDIHVGTLIRLAKQHGWTPRTEKDGKRSYCTRFSETTRDWHAAIADATKETSSGGGFADDETPEVDFKSGNSVDVDEPEPVELSKAPAPYVPPPLELLPSVLQEFVHAGAEMLNVDISFIFLPLLSAIGATIGNARSILLKLGYIQPPNIWTGILGPSGTLKSPSIETACFANDERERELDQQNREAQEIYAEDLAQWESQKKSLRGRKPDPPEIKTCKMDDLTLEALADRLQSNPRGVLIAKDEISGFFESFDLYRKNQGADVSRWLSLHSGAHFGIDRRTDNRHQRIWLPRVCITGGVQPKVFKRLMREDYFERGLPARFIFAAPPCKLKWSNSIISNELIQAVRELFDQLWLLQPNHDDHKQPAPMLLRLTGEAREEYIAFYNQCGASTAKSSENEAAAWSKLPGYGGRFALEGQLTCNPHAEKVTGEVMRAACELARWSGNETARIYAQLSETPWQQAQRELIEFIDRRGGAVYEREVMQSFTRLKNDKEGTARELDALVKAGRGKWEPIDHGGGPGRPARQFQLLRSSTSTQFSISRGKTRNSVDVDTYRDHEITPATPPDGEPAGVSVPLLITRQMEAELIRRGLTQSEIDKLTPQQAHEILAADKESAKEPADIAIGQDPEGETIL